MSRADTEPEGRPEWLSERALWRRSQMIDAPEDEAARLLDLAGFADGLLDPDERDRVAALVAADPAAEADVAAAQTLAAGAAGPTQKLDRIIARASALLPGPPSEAGRVISFVPVSRRRWLLRGFTQWGSLAAAIAVASWLGFAMGSDASLALSQPAQASDVSSLPELLDPVGGFLRDLGEGLRT